MAATEEIRYGEMIGKKDEKELLARLDELTEAPLEGTLEVALDLLHHPSGRVRARAARLCGQLGRAEAVPALKTLLSPHSPREVVQEALESLAAIGSDSVWKTFAAILENTTDPTHTPLLDVLAHHDGPHQLVPTLKKTLLRAGYPFKSRVLEVLRNYRGPSVEALLQEYLDEPSESLAQEAARGLALFPSPDNYARLAARMKLGPWTVQIACLEAMLAIESRPAPADLEPALDASHPEVTLRALEVLTRRLEAEALPMIQALVTAASWKVRERVARVLGATEDPRVLCDVERLTGDERAAVRAAAFAGSTRLPGVDHQLWGERAAKDSEAVVRRQAAPHLAEAGGLLAQNRLLALLDDPIAEVRLTALEALEAFELAGHEDRITAMVADPEPEVRTRARKLLVSRGRPSDEAHLHRALELVDAGELAEAQALLRRLAVDRPTDPQVLYELARVCLRLEDPGEAEVYLRKVVEERPEHVGAQKHLAEVLLEQGRRAEAAEHLREACGGDRGNWKLWCTYGELLLEEGHHRAAVGAFESSLRIHHSHRAAHRGLARAYEGCGDLEGALREWTWLHEKDAGGAAPLSEMGRLHLVLGHPEEAACFLARARDLGADAPAELSRMADALDALGSHDQALVLREEAAARGGLSRDEHLALARAYLAAGQASRALQVIKNLQGHEDPTPELLEVEASCHEALDELETALDARIKLLGLDEEHPGARRAFAHLLMRMGRIDQARQALRNVLERAPQDLATRWELIRLELGQGKTVSALRLLEQGMDLHALEADLRTEAARLHRRRGETHLALRRALEAVEIEPEDLAARELLGDLYRETGSPRSARECYEQVLERGREDARVRFLVGRSYLEEGAPAKALLHLERAERGRFAENPDLHQALGEAHLLLGRHGRARPYLAKAAALSREARPYELLARLELAVDSPRDALDHVRALIEVAPDHPERMLLEGLCRRHLGEVGAALACFEKALYHHPGSPRVIAELAACYLELGRHREATGLYPGSPLLPAEDEALKVAKGTAHLAMGNHAKAAQLAREMIELDPDLVPARALLARALRRGGQLVDAELTLNQALQLRPDDGELLEERARVHLEKRYYDAALADAHHALGLPERSPTLYLVQAQALRGRRDDQKALESLGNYLLRCPRDAEGHLTLARTLRDLGRRQEAAEAYQNALALEKNREEAYLELAEIQVEEARPEDAARSLESYLEVSETRGPALRRLAELRERAGELDRAAESLRELVQVEDGEEARYRLVQVLLRRKDLGAAWPVLERSASLYPELPRRLGEEFLEGGDPALAKDLFGHALTVDPHDVHSLHLLGVCHYRLGSYAASKRAQGRVLDRLPLHGGAHFYLGLVQLVDEAPTAAREHFQRAVEADPENLVCYRHLARLHLEAGEAEEARGWARAGLERDATDRELLLSLAGAAERLDDDAEALDAYRRAGARHVDVRSHLPAMRIALRQGRADLARELGEHYVAARPEDSTGLRLLARAAAADGDPARSVDVLEALCAEGAATADDRRTLARGYTATERWDRAAEVCEECLREDPTHADTWLLLGHVETARRRWGDAAHAYKQVTELSPARADAWRGLASTLLEQSRTREAEKPAERAAELQPADPRNLHVLGRVRKVLGRPDRARQALEAALAIRPHGDLAATIRLELAAVLRSLGEPGNARKILEAVPGDAGREAARQLVEIAFEAQDYSAVVHHAKGFLARYPVEAGVLEFMGCAFVQLGMDRQAASCLERHVSLHGIPVRLTEELARGRIERDQTGEAIQLLVQGLEKEPRAAGLWRVMAEARRARRDLRGAREALERAFDLDPACQEVARELGELYLTDGIWDRARALYRDATRSHPYNTHFHLGLGRALIGQGELDEARAAFQKAVEASPRAAEAHRELGLLLARQGHRARAVEALERAVRLDDSDVGALHALARAHRDLGRTELAETHFQRLLQVAPARSVESKAARTFLNHRKAA